MAQLGARLNGIQKVRGSNPLISIVENSWFYHEFQLVEKGRLLAAFFSSYHPTCSKMYVG